MAKRKYPLEADFQRRVLVKLRALPKSWWMKANDRSTIGLPDIIGFLGAFGVALELKTNSKLSQIQLYTLEKINACGAINFVVTPDNFDAVYAYLQAVSDLEFKRAKYPLAPNRIPPRVL